MKTLLLFLAIWATTSSLLANFVPPAKDVLLFRRDALALDANRQRLLSKDLLALASRTNALKNPAERRATAQLLALATNLNPDSKGPQNLANLFTSKKEDEIAIVEELEKPLQNISSAALFLLEDTNNTEHLAIAQLLLDPLVTIAPVLDIILTRPHRDESERWQHAIAPVENFITRQDPLPPAPEEKPIDKEITSTETETPEPTDSEKKVLLKVKPINSSITVPTFVDADPRAATLNSEGKMIALRFRGELKKEGHIALPISPNSQTLPIALQTLLQNLNRSHDQNDISRIKGKFRLNNSIYSDRNADTFALPMALLAEGLLNEQVPLANLTTIGSLTTDGQINAPKIPWQFLQILLASESNEPRRLLVSPQMVPLLETLLTNHEEAVFFDLDIFVVETLSEATALAFKDSQPAQTVEALEKFQQIRQVGKGKETSVFVTNKHVLTRLQEVTALEPRFLSATLLAKRGSGDYPTQYSTEILATLIQSSLMPLTRVPYLPSQNLIAGELDIIHSNCRANLDPLARNVAFRDRETYDTAVNLTNRIRTLARAKTRLNKAENYTYHTSLLNKTLQTIQLEYFEFATQIAQILGQNPPSDPRIPQN